MKSLPLLLFLLLTALHLRSQVLLDKDSLFRVLPTAKEDSSKVLLLINIGRQFEGGEPEVAKQYYRQARDLSKKIGYRLGEIKYISNYTYVLNMQGQYDSSLILNLQSLAIAREIKNEEYILRTLFNTGTSYRMLDDHEKALQYYLEAYPMIKASGDQSMLAQANDIMQSMYTSLKQYAKSAAYGLQAVAILRNDNNPYSLGVALTNLSINYIYLRRFDTARILCKEALQIAQDIGDKYMESSQYLNIGDTYLQEFDYEKSTPYMWNALRVSREIGAKASEASALRGLAYGYHVTGQLKRAKAYGDSSLAISTALNLRPDKQLSYVQLSNLAFAMHDYKLGEWYAMKSTQLFDSIMNETIQKKAVELEKKYETRMKDDQIKLQQASIHNKTMWNYVLISGAAAMLLILLLVYRNYRGRQRLQQQRIHKLEQEKQLAATAAVLKGEEQERTRLAKDLHDGLGGMLSGIQHSLNAMKRNLVMTPENAAAFERSISMLDGTIHEMRRVAHNMMPEALVKFGLDTALEDLCESVSQSGALTVNYQSIDLQSETIEQTKAITVYRIIQELLNNIIKHAEASTAIVQVSQTNNTISITVEDNGKGFDTSLLRESSGMGLHNIRHRIEFLNGKWDVHSQRGKGTSVHIEFVSN